MILLCNGLKKILKKFKRKLKSNYRNNIKSKLILNNQKNLLKKINQMKLYKDQIFQNLN